MPTTNSSRMELGELVIFRPVLQAYPTRHSWIITAHISLGNLECHWKLFNRQLARTPLPHHMPFMLMPTKPVYILPTNLKMPFILPSLDFTEILLLLWILQITG